MCMLQLMPGMASQEFQAARGLLDLLLEMQPFTPTHSGNPLSKQILLGH